MWLMGNVVHSVTDYKIRSYFSNPQNKTLEIYSQNFTQQYILYYLFKRAEKRALLKVEEAKGRSVQEHICS